MRPVGMTLGKLEVFLNNFRRLTVFFFLGFLNGGLIMNITKILSQNFRNCFLIFDIKTFLSFQETFRKHFLKSKQQH